jgi:hypothetical protein
MRYPYSLFLKFLISRKADVNRTLGSLGLPEIAAKERTEHDTPAAPLPKSVEKFFQSPDNCVKDTVGFLEWAKVHDIGELWSIQPEFVDKTKPRPKAQMQHACELFADPNKRTSLAVLLLKGFSDEAISEIFEEKFDRAIDAETLQLAKKYFFDFSRLNKADWDNLLHAIPKDQKAMLHLGLEPHSKEFVQYSVGKLPSLSFDDIMHDIMVSSYYKFKKCLDQPLADTKAMHWANLAMRAGVNKVKFGRGEQVDFDGEMQLRFEFTTPEFPTITELSTPEQNDR